MTTRQEKMAAAAAAGGDPAAAGQRDRVDGRAGGAHDRQRQGEDVERSVRERAAKRGAGWGWLRAPLRVRCT